MNGDKAGQSNAMDSKANSAIITNITPTQLECSLHCDEFQCLLKIWTASTRSGSTNTSSNDFDGNCHGGSNYSVTNNNPPANAGSALRVSSIPDISSIAIIPVLSHGTGSEGQSWDLHDAFSNRQHRTHPVENDGDHDFIFLPFQSPADNAVNERPHREIGKIEQHEFFGNVGKFTNQNHPCQDLIRISRDLITQMKERLKDASDGVNVPHEYRKLNTNDEDGRRNGENRRHNFALSILGGYEEFLLRSDAIFQEFLSVVKQQLRSEQQFIPKIHRNKKARIIGSSQLSHTTSPPLKYYSSLLRQLQTLQSMPGVEAISLQKRPYSSTITRENLLNALPTDLTRISVTCVDDSLRSHTWHAELYPSIVLTVDLPIDFSLENDPEFRLERWWEEGETPIATNKPNENAMLAFILPKINQAFQQILQKHQLIFNELDDLDFHLWILEPSLPATRNCVERRIALWEGGASMVIVLDPEKPRGVPALVRFLGVTLATMKAVAESSGVSEVRDWKASFAEFVSEDGNSRADQKGLMDLDIIDSAARSGIKRTSKKRWSEERSIRENLELWFGSPLPSPHKTKKSEFLVECGICYTHRLPLEDSSIDPDSSAEESPLPEVKCNNTCCNRNYHESCLFEWFHSLPTARVSFDRIFGSCPYCCEAVSVRILNGSNNQ